MDNLAVSLGYVILYVNDVGASLSFYERAFGLSRRFYNDENGKAYGELETGSARLSFASVRTAQEHLQKDLVAAPSPNEPLSFEVALVTADVAALFGRAVRAGATPLREPETKPWGQTVAYVRDSDGHIVEICTPMS